MNSTDSTSTTKSTNVQVAVRCRPANAEERKGNQATVVSCDIENKQVKVNYGPMAKKISKVFSFDKVFGMYSTQEEVFQSMVLPIVEETLAGFNCTIFAYGQTGTGKTHTMEGDIHCEENAGVIPRAVRSILEKLESAGSEFTIRVSFLELYNEELQDLLATDSNTPGSTDDKRLRLCEDAKKGVVCQNLEEITVLDVHHLFEILQKGIKQRQTAATLCNKNSSRSHSIFTLKIMIKETNVEGEEVVRHGQLNLVDLAGSECVGRSGATNARAREAGSINQSLLTLGRVITALVDHHGHIPYRDSKLTRILQESLGGRAKTCIIATLSPSVAAVEESLSTLDYAHRAKSIKNAPQVNQRMTKKVVLKEYCAEIESLKQMLQITREKNGVYVDPLVFEQMEARLSSQEGLIAECESALRVRTEEVKTLKEEMLDVAVKLEDAKGQLEETEGKLEEAETNLAASREEAAYLKVEWGATEGVVKEQVSTEEWMTSYATDLQGDVTMMQDDITNLFAKVDRHAYKERSRIESIVSFVSELNGSQSHLQSSVREMLCQSDGQSKELCRGVSDMLVRGNDMCAVLKESIAGALTVLIGDTVVVKDKMTASCDGLQVHLAETRSEVITSLQTLQDSLSLWLGDVKLNMEATQRVLNQQQKQMLDLMQDVDAMSVQYEQASQQFLLSQQTHSANSLKDISTLRDDISVQITELKEMSASQLKQHEELVEQKTEHIQKTMAELLVGMSQSFSSSSQSDLKKTHTRLSALDQICTTSLTGLSRSIAEHNVTASSSQADMQNVVSSSKGVFTRHINSSQSFCEEALGKVEDVASTAGKKKQVLDKTITNLSDGISAAVDKARSEVDCSAQTTTTMLEDVKMASQKMDSVTSECMTGFGSYIDGQGDALNTELGVHFDSIKTFLRSQDDGLTHIRREGESFLEVAQDDVVKRTGSTPEKKAFKPPQDITHTRDHAEIKDEFRQKVNKRSHGDFAVNTSVTESPLKRLSGDKSEASTVSSRNLSVDCGDDESDISGDGENADPQVHSPSASPSETDKTTLKSSAPPSPSRRNTSPVPAKKRTMTRLRSATSTTFRSQKSCR